MAAFATKYAGQAVSFDGSVSAVLLDENDTYTLGIGAGDKGGNTALGPNFQFLQVGDTDLSPAGSDALEVGTKFHRRRSE